MYRSVDNGIQEARRCSTFNFSHGQDLNSNSNPKHVNQSLSRSPSFERYCEVVFFILI